MAIAALLIASGALAAVVRIAVLLRRELREHTQWKALVNEKLRDLPSHSPALPARPPAQPPSPPLRAYFGTTVGRESSPSEEPPAPKRRTILPRPRKP